MHCQKSLPGEGKALITDNLNQASAAAQPTQAIMRISPSRRPMSEQTTPAVARPFFASSFLPTIPKMRPRTPQMIPTTPSEPPEKIEITSAIMPRTNDATAIISLSFELI